MNRSERLQPVVQLTNRKEKDAAQALGVARQEVNAEEKKLNDLVSYRHEYILDFQRKGRAGLSGAALQQFQGFLTRLEQAIDQQKSRLGGAHQQVQGRTQALSERMVQAKAINNAVGQFSQQEQAQRDKREQRVQDDRARQPLKI